MPANSLQLLDHDHLIHPVVSLRGHEARGVTILSSAQGAMLTDIEGKTLLDGFSGLWCVNIGYGQESVVRAATEQMRRLPYATGYFHYGSEPAILLAAKLAALAPGDLDHVFFTLGGSDAVDTTLRLIRFYFNMRGEPTKRHIIALERGYHGSSSTGAGVTALAAFHRGFDLPTGLQHHIPSVYPYRNELRDPEAQIAASVAALRAEVEALGADNVAAFFCEPIQGSGGIIVPPAGWLAAMRAECRRLGILFVADEVITGFGRTGPMFACEDEAVVPDFMTLAKGLTSGYAPMGAVMVSDPIYQVIADGTPAGTPLGHGYTYSAHPVSAAVALEVIRLYEEGGILANGQEVGAYFQRRLQSLLDHPLVGEVRGRGMLAGLELVVDKATKRKPPAALRLHEFLAAEGYRQGLIFRAFADDVIGLAPPLCCTEAEIDILIERLGKTLDAALQHSEIRHEAH
ncbi:MAG: aminotransferase class III-fold pyridoxal phosphate-dependent enzyme [Rhodospirillales bacterium]|nr:aminotransferase class III-fold pyridoxal phosphate-dependent enzyme [Rhodospirillales bacterium]